MTILPKPVFARVKTDILLGIVVCVVRAINKVEILVSGVHTLVKVVPLMVSVLSAVMAISSRMAHVSKLLLIFLVCTKLTGKVFNAVEGARNVILVVVVPVLRDTSRVMQNAFLVGRAHLANPAKLAIM